MREILEAASSCRVLLSLHRIQELHICQLLEWGKREAEFGGHGLCRTPADGHEGRRIYIVVKKNLWSSSQEVTFQKAHMMRPWRKREPIPKAVTVVFIICREGKF